MRSKIFRFIRATARAAGGKLDGIATYLGWRRRTVEIHGGAHRVNCSHSAQSAPFESEMWTYLELKQAHASSSQEINIRFSQTEKEYQAFEYSIVFIGNVK